MDADVRPTPHSDRGLNWADPGLNWADRDSLFGDQPL
jgi:hypothetical protein